MLKQTLSQKMLQKLSPQQIQLMKLLQIPTATLEQRIEEELEANPALEEGETQDEAIDAEPESLAEDGQEEEAYELDDYLNEYMEDDPVSYKTAVNHQSTEEEDKDIPRAVEHSLHEYLEEQLGLMQIGDERREVIAHQIIGSIDEDGYLRREPSAIIDDLMFAKNILATEAQVLSVLELVQRMEPPGIGARDLQECLLIQLSIKAEQDDEEDFLDFDERKRLDLAIEVVEHYFDEFTKKHYDKLLSRLDISEAALKGAISEILKLNPKPASGYGSGDSRAQQYVVPDFTIQNRDGELELSLNSRNAPDLCVSDQYQDMLRSYKKKSQGRRSNKKEQEAILFIKQKIDSAKWFIDAIRQRQDTMLRTMNAIMQYQYDYLLTGDTRKLRPMILKDISDITGLDISTISRVANSKFVQTEFGTKRLKEFFSEGMSKDDGEEVSTREVKQILEEIIGQENKKKPLSDQKLQKALADKGYPIARRTVAKYREQLNLPVARLRKAL